MVINKALLWTVNGYTLSWLLCLCHSDFIRFHRKNALYSVHTVGTGQEVRCHQSCKSLGLQDRIHVETDLEQVNSI